MNTPEEFVERAMENLGPGRSRSSYIYGQAGGQPFLVFIARGDLAREMHPVVHGITRLVAGKTEGVAKSA